MAVKNLKKNLLSLVFTLFVIGFLIMSGPVAAITLSLTTDKTIYATDGTITFEMSLDIETNERVPIQNLTLTIQDSTNNVVKTCIFRPDGTAISGCDNVVITPEVDSSSYGYGDQFGYGYGYDGSSYGTQNNTFGYGYGYGYATDVTGEMKYTVEWDLSSETATEGTYGAQLSAVAQSNTNKYTFLSSKLYFTIGSTTENNVTTPASGTVTFTDPAIQATIPQITGLTAGWIVNASVYGETNPGWTAPQNTGLSFIEISVDQSTAGGSYTIFFNIAQSVLTANGIAAADVRLFVLDGASWTELTTTVVDGAADPVEFSAVTSHFSRFVAAEKVATTTTTTETTGGGGRRTTPSVVVITPTPTTPVEEEEEIIPAVPEETVTPPTTPATPGAEGDEGLEDITGAVTAGQGVKNTFIGITIALLTVIIGLGAYSYINTGKLFRFRKQ